jgi:hypothetical protein
MLVDLDRIGPAGLLYHILVVPGCTFLLLLINGRVLKKKKKAAKKDKAEKKNKRRDETMLCHNCGAKLKDEAAFCTNCGTSVQAAVEEAVNVTRQDAQPPLKKDIPPQNNTTLVGWSSHSNHPEILEAARKNKKSTIGCGFILVLLFPIGFLLAGLFMDDMPLNEAIIIGVGLGVLMLVINLWRMKDLKGSVWEGVVIKKYNKERRSHNKDDDLTTYMEYTTVIKTEAGKEKRIIERDSRRHMYDYLAVGDRVRFHPAFATYEKYDKSKDRIIYCNVCSMQNPIANDRCKRCNNLLFK